MQEMEELRYQDFHNLDNCNKSKNEKCMNKINNNSNQCLAFTDYNISMITTHALNGSKKQQNKQMARKV